MKKTVSVSIDEGILAKAKERAWKERKSMSQFIEDMVSLTLEKHQVVYPFEPQETQKPVAEYPDTVEDKVVGYVEEADENAKTFPDRWYSEELEKKDQLHDKNKAMLSKIMDTVTEIHKSRSETKNPMSDYFKPQPKLKDKAKK